MSKLLLASDVASKLCLSTQRIRQMDDRLKPEVTPAGVRVYREDAIDELLRERDRRAFELIEQYEGVPALEAMQAELQGKADAYRRTRLDGILADEPNLKHKAFCRDVVTFANRVRGTRLRRYDATDASLVPAVKWPMGFDRAKAIKVLDAAGFNPFGYPGSMYQSLASADDAWLLGALQQVLDTLTLRASAEDMLIKLGYRAVDGYWQFGGGPLKTPAPKSAPAARVDESEKTFSHRDSWKRPLAVVTEDEDA